VTNQHGPVDVACVKQLNHGLRVATEITRGAAPVPSRSVRRDRPDTSVERAEHLVPVAARPRLSVQENDRFA
jgi:hypothetical protein